MKTYPILTKDGHRAFAFEVENVYLSPAAAARLAATVDDVSEVVVRSVFSKSSDVHVEFKYRGQPYIVWEPYGDSSRYWIGPKEEARDAGDITALESAFSCYRPPMHRALLGNILTFQFVTHFLSNRRSKS